MNDKAKVKILPEDKFKLSQDEKNLIELAFVNEIPPIDAKFIKEVKKESLSGQDSYAKLSQYYTNKYGIEFGMVYLSAITGGEEKYKETIETIERMRALKRIEKANQN
ncbi:hypothetical protein HY025_04735 [Candidatus Daviesbacteria bacterium]|nr:hypothetical protein [Candidatus Daviesbacteria bacterium]